jgi:hypothetical protein
MENALDKNNDLKKKNQLIWISDLLVLGGIGDLLIKWYDFVALVIPSYVFGQSK